jgi:hypothetical protein
MNFHKDDVSLPRLRQSLERLFRSISVGLQRSAAFTAFTIDKAGRQSHALPL